MKDRASPSPRAASAPSASPSLGAWAYDAILAGAVALLVMAVLIPSESAISDGTFAPLAAGWCVLLVAWSLAVWLRREPLPRPTPTEWAGLALVAWHTLAAVVSLGSGNGRQTLSAAWLLIGYALAVFLLRRCLRSPAQVRGLVAALLWLATLAAALGLFQYFYSMPLKRAQYAADPERALAEAGISTEAGSPQRELFENRLQSVEPLGPFALTNSLAGFLAPWLIPSVALLVAAWSRRPPLRTWIGWLAAALTIGTCLVLTKSRTAYLAALVGVALVALYGRPGSRTWRPGWRVLTAAGGAAVLLALLGVLLGGLDAKVLSEAPKSVLYRVQYWQATSALIARQPLFGCGPGNFQQAYTAYKLPEASESVADPHNFLLEMWATAGTPAFLLLVLFLVAIGVDLSGSQPAEEAHFESNSLGPQSPQPAPRAGALAGGRVWAGAPLVGAALGLVLAPLISSLVGYPLEAVAGEIFPVAWLLGVPLLAALWWAAQPWIQEGELPAAAVVLPILVLLVNLLAAGAFVFPGVMTTLVALLPAGLVLSTARHGAGSAPGPAGRAIRQHGGHADARPPRAAVAMVAVAVVLAVACVVAEYQPVLRSRAAMAEAFYHLQRGNPNLAQAAAEQAAAADRWSPEPWRMLAELHLGRWLASGDPAYRQAFEAAAQRFTSLHPRHHQAWQSRGNWYLTAWRKSQQDSDLRSAIEAYRQAVVCYPNHAAHHAQLAWALHLAGDDRLAAEEAARAKVLDDRMPHREQKLSRQRIFDPELSAAGSEPTTNSAEQIVERLRTTAKENTP